MEFPNIGINFAEPPILSKNYCKFAHVRIAVFGMAPTAIMLVNSTNITDKKYRKLAIRIGLHGFSYCIFDTLNNMVLTVADVNFKDFAKVSRVEDHYWKAFVDDPILTKEYDEVTVLHQNNLNTFVPQAIFDEDFLGSYLQYNAKVFETDFFTFDELPNYEINNVYIPYANINNFLIDQYGPFEYRHSNTVLVTKLLDHSKNNDEKQVFVHFDSDRLEIIVVQNQQLLLFNSFDYTTKEDFIYYLLFAAEQLNLNPEHFNLQLLGSITKDSELFDIAYKYVRNVALYDISNQNQTNDLSSDANRKHFILMNS